MKKYTSLSVWVDRDDIRNKIIYQRMCTHTMPDVILYHSPFGRKFPYKLDAKIIYFEEEDELKNKLNKSSLCNQIDFLKIYSLSNHKKYTDDDYLLVHDSDCIYNKSQEFNFENEYQMFLDGINIENYATVINTKFNIFSNLLKKVLLGNKHTFLEYRDFCRKNYNDKNYICNINISFERGNLWKKIFFEDLS